MVPESLAATSSMLYVPDPSEDRESVSVDWNVVNRMLSTIPDGPVQNKNN